jgi:hypothetical protein
MKKGDPAKPRKQAAATLSEQAGYLLTEYLFLRNSFFFLGLILFMLLDSGTTHHLHLHALDVRCIHVQSKKLQRLALSSAVEP